MDGTNVPGGDDGSPDTAMRVSTYLTRIGIESSAVTDTDWETLARLQNAHVRTIPFETLDITGDPHGSRTGTAVRLSVPHLYDKIVRRGRGGYCFELNGLFAWLLSEIGYHVDRVAARVVTDGGVRIPANHHTILVGRTDPWLVDVGLGPPMLRRPLGLDGAMKTDSAGVSWRVVESERPDVSFCLEHRPPGEEQWRPRYVFDDEPRSLDYFEATNDYFQSAPESPFTGDPFVGLSTQDGYRALSPDTLTEVVGPSEQEQNVSAENWHGVLEERFGLRYDAS